MEFIVKRSFVLILGLLPLLASAQQPPLWFSQNQSNKPFTFACVVSGRLEGDSCDICPFSVVESRSFNGLIILRDSVPYRWIDQPYSIRVKPGEFIEYWEHGVSPYNERFTVPLALTSFTTIQAMADSTFCNATTPGNFPNWYASDSLEVAPISRGDTVTIVGRSIISVTFDSLLKKYIIDADTTGLGGGGSGSGTVTYVGATAPAEGFSITGAPITTSGTLVFTLENDLEALELLTGTGIPARTGTDTWALRTLTAGTGIGVTNGDGVAGSPTIENTAPDQVVSLTGAGITVVTGAYPNFTITSNEVDGSTTNEIQTYTHTGTTSYTNTLSSGGGAFTIQAGANVTVSHAAGTITIAATGGSNYQTFRDDGTGLTQRANANFVSSARVSMTLTDDAANSETEVVADIVNSSIGTTQLANDAVTYAKLQNAAANNVVLGNINGAGTDWEELTIANLYTLLGLTGVANRFALWTGANTLSSDAAFTFDAANDRMTITGTVVGTGPNNAWLNLNGGALTGAAEAMRASATMSDDLIVAIENARNISNTGNATFQAKVGGANAADPRVQFIVNGVVTHSIGIDNSDGDKLKFTPNATTPGGQANAGLIITNEAPPKVGINKDVPTQALDVVGRTKSSTGFMGTFAQWVSGNISFGAGAGTGPTLNTVSGTDNALYVSFTTGTTPTNNGTIFTATYPNSWGNSAFVTFSADGTNNSATNLTLFRTGGRTAAKFDFVANGTLPASTNFQFCFQIWGQ